MASSEDNRVWAAAEMISESFICPITFELIRDPAICVDGHSYERGAVAEWLKLGNSESPRTNAMLESTKLTSNSTLKLAIQSWTSARVELMKGGEPAEVQPVANETTAEDDKQVGASAGYPENVEGQAAPKKNRRKKKKKGGGGSAVIEAFSNSLLCPFTKKIMQDPVVCADGYSYERVEMEERFASGNMESGKSGKKLEHKSFIPNIQLRQAIEAWLEVLLGREGEAEVEGAAPCEEEAEVAPRAPKQKQKKKAEPLCPESSLERLAIEASGAELTAEQKQWFMSRLTDTNDLQKGGLTPMRVCSLVQRNPMLALESLIRLSSKHHINQYLTALVALSLSVNSMEVVNRLINAIVLPPNFIQAYVIRCVRACSEISKDASKQSFVKVLCVFLYQLIRCKKLNVSPHLIEMQAFCIEFPHVKEASTLHRLLKSMDQEELSTRR